MRMGVNGERMWCLMLSGEWWKKELRLDGLA